MHPLRPQSARVLPPGVVLLQLLPLLCRRACVRPAWLLRDLRSLLHLAPTARWVVPVPVPVPALVLALALVLVSVLLLRLPPRWAWTWT